MTLKCSIPIPFSFNLQVLRPHPYFKVEPLEGVIPASGTIDIKITFSPITLGTCSTTIKLHVAQHGYEAFETVVSARAVMGAHEKRGMSFAQDNVAQFAFKTGSTINNVLGNSSFSAPMTMKSSIDDSHPLFKTRTVTFSNLLVRGPPKKLYDDPVATVLASTFRAYDLSGALDKALKETLLGSRRKYPIKTGPLRGVHAVLGESVHKEYVPPRGPGSGAHFDAGAQWMSSMRAKAHRKKKSQTAGRLDAVPEDTTRGGGGLETVEGLRVPTNLDSVGTVSFVLTQETGKLKPKDLKAAIEKNRAEKKLREEEQRKIREQGGLSGASGLDLRSVMAEENLNAAEGDSFKRQLREMAFLADVDDVAKEETEKAFRTSEQYLGSSLLSEEDVASIQAHRALASRVAAMNSWKRTLDRQSTELYPPHHQTQKAGSLKPPAAADEARVSDLPVVTDLQAGLSFDANRNDVWAKRMNTQRRFVSLVGRWIVRRRGEARAKKIKDRLSAAGVTDRESCKAFVSQDNSERVGTAVAAAGKRDDPSSAAHRALADAGAAAQSVAALVCSLPNQSLLNRLAGENALAQGRSRDMQHNVRRVLFPRYTVDQAGERSPLDPIDLMAQRGFDDRTLFQAKVRPEYVNLGYTELIPPVVPVFFPRCAAKEQREGAPEESLTRPPADQSITADVLAKFLPPSLAVLKDFASGRLPPSAPAAGEAPPAAATIPAIKPQEFLPAAAASWLATPAAFSLGEVNYFRPRPDLRAYVPLPRRKESDDDWALRPLGEKLEFDNDQTWGGR